MECDASRYLVVVFIFLVAYLKVVLLVDIFIDSGDQLADVLPLHFSALTMKVEPHEG